MFNTNVPVPPNPGNVPLRPNMTLLNPNALIPTGNVPFVSAVGPAVTTLGGSVPGIPTHIKADTGYHIKIEPAPEVVHNQLPRVKVEAGYHAEPPTEVKVAAQVVPPPPTNGQPPVQSPPQPQPAVQPGQPTGQSPAVLRTWQLLSVGPLFDKTYGVASFMERGTPIELKNWQAPIHIARAGLDPRIKQKMLTPDMVHTPQEKSDARKGIQKVRRVYPMHLEDSAKKNVFNGSLEMDQSNRFEKDQSYKYVILKNEGGVFKVIPCDDWYSFKREQKNIPLSYEEAERILKERSKAEKSEAKKTEKVEKSHSEPRSHLSTILKSMEEAQEKTTTARPNEEAEEEIKGKKKKKSEKPEELDFDDVFEDDNKEDKVVVKQEKKKKLSKNSKEVKKLISPKNWSDDEEKDFPGVEAFFEDSKSSAAEKRAADPQAPQSTAKKPRTDAGRTAAVSTEKEIEKKIVDFLNLNGKCPLPKLIKYITPFLAGTSKDTLKSILKRIAEAKKDGGETWLYLKSDQYGEYR